MTEKELKHMSRRELIELIATMKKMELELRSKIEAYERQLAHRTVQIANAGSIAEAALSLNGVFEAAQAAADTYIQSLHAANADIELRRARTEEECAQLLRDTETETTARLQTVDKQCTEKLAATDAQIEQRWAAFESNVQNVLQSHSELSNYLGLMKN